MSSCAMSGDDSDAFSTSVRIAFIVSLIGAVRWSFSTASMRVRLPVNSAATAACAPVQKMQLRNRDVNAAIISRSPGVSGEGPRITPWLNAARCSVHCGL